MFILSACESKLLIFKTDILLKNNVPLDLKEELKSLGPVVDGKKIMLI